MNLSFTSKVLVLAVMLTLSITAVFAYPPAPGVSVHGLVRDQYGWVLRHSGAEVVINADGHELARQPIVSNLKFNENFRLQLPIDTGADGAPYRPGALEQDSIFTVEIHIDKKIYYPIETFLLRGNGAAPVRGAFQIEEAGESIRLDLTLGEDLDGDGLPDDWEYWQLETAGLSEGDSGFNLDFFSADGDADHDGVSDLEEFHAGTVASSRDDSIQLDVVGHLGDSGLLELKYRALNGKAYILEMSGDGKVWVSAPVSLDDPHAPPQTAWFARKTSEQTVFAPAEQPFRIFRLRVR